MGFKRNPFTADNIFKVCKTNVLKFSTSYNLISK